MPKHDVENSMNFLPQHNGNAISLSSKNDVHQSQMQTRKVSVSELSCENRTYERYRGTPWRATSDYTSSIIGLHNEIIDFYKYMSPRTEERSMRLEVVDRIEKTILFLWPKAEVEIFGSFRTGLYLPTSDIDLVVFGKWENLPLWTLGRELKERGIVDENNIKVLDKASVPILKLIDKHTDVRVDISFNVKNGVKSARLIKNFTETFPTLPYLVLVLKQFLVQRDFNEVFTGGLSSYSLILMTVNFLQLHHRDVKSIKPNIALLLLEFLQLYGYTFNYARTGISVQTGGILINKSGDAEQFNNTSSFLFIEDPLSPDNDISRSSYAIYKIRDAFRLAYCSLYNQVQMQADKVYPSLLSCIVKVCDEVVEYRSWVASCWPTAPQPHLKPQTPFHQLRPNGTMKPVVVSPRQEQSRDDASSSLSSASSSGTGSDSDTEPSAHGQLMVQSPVTETPERFQQAFQMQTAFMPRVIYAQQPIMIPYQPRLWLTNQPNMRFQRRDGPGSVAR